MRKFFFLPLFLVCAYTSFAGDRLISSVSDSSRGGDDFYATPYAKRNSGSFGRHTYLLSVGYGFAPNFNRSDLWLNYDFTYDTHNHFGPVSIEGEWSLADEFGLSLSTQLATEKWTGYFDNGLTTKSGNELVLGTAIGLMGVYHFNKLIPSPTFDVFAGLGGAYRQNVWTVNFDNGFDGGSVASDKVEVLAEVGIRCYVGKHFAFYGKIGNLGLSTVNAGITFRRFQRIRKHKTN